MDFDIHLAKSGLIAQTFYKNLSDFIKFITFCYGGYFWKGPKEATNFIPSSI